MIQTPAPVLDRVPFRKEDVIQGTTATLAARFSCHESQ